MLAQHDKLWYITDVRAKLWKVPLIRSITTPSMVYKKRHYKKHSLNFRKMEKHGLPCCVRPRIKMIRERISPDTRKLPSISVPFLF